MTKTILLCALYALPAQVNANGFIDANTLTNHKLDRGGFTLPTPAKPKRGGFTLPKPKLK